MGSTDMVVVRDMKLGRWVALAFAFGIALATLGGGEHYLVDLVAAFPFSLAVWSLCMGDVPLHHPRRMLPFAGSCAVLLVWIACIRLAPQLFWISPVIPWGASIAIVAGTLVTLSNCWPVPKQRPRLRAAVPDYAVPAASGLHEGLKVRH